jgi:hypothetical protein
MEAMTVEERDVAIDGGLSAVHEALVRGAPSSEAPAYLAVVSELVEHHPSANAKRWHVHNVHAAYHAVIDRIGTEG